MTWPVYWLDWTPSDRLSCPLRAKFVSFKSLDHFGCRVTDCSATGERERERLTEGWKEKDGTRREIDRERTPQIHREERQKQRQREQKIVKKKRETWQDQKGFLTFAICFVNRFETKFVRGLLWEGANRPSWFLLPNMIKTYLLSNCAVIMSAKGQRTK